MDSKKVLVCGPPRSGNRVIASFLEQAGVRAVRAHYPPDIRRNYDATHAVVIVRSSPFWEKEVCEHEQIKENIVRHMGPTMEPLHLVILREILNALRVNTTVITYEALVSHTREVLDDLCVFVGVEPLKEFNYTIYDGNDKYDDDGWDGPYQPTGKIKLSGKIR